jgi:phage shock protein A
VSISKIITNGYLKDIENLCVLVVNTANSASMRLLRLSESAEKLKKQAAISMQKGDENYARDMLLQRKKVLQALEKSKSRIELLDELSTKLSEVK